MRRESDLTYDESIAAPARFACPHAGEGNHGTKLAGQPVVPDCRVDHNIFGISR